MTSYETMYRSTSSWCYAGFCIRDFSSPKHQPPHDTTVRSVSQTFPVPNTFLNYESADPAPQNAVLFPWIQNLYQNNTSTGQPHLQKRLLDLLSAQVNFLIMRLLLHPDDPCGCWSFINQLYLLTFLLATFWISNLSKHLGLTYKNTGQHPHNATVGLQCAYIIKHVKTLPWTTNIQVDTLVMPLLGSNVCVCMIIYIYMSNMPEPKHLSQ